MLKGKKCYLTLEETPFLFVWSEHGKIGLLHVKRDYNFEAFIATLTAYNPCIHSFHALIGKIKYTC